MCDLSVIIPVRNEAKSIPILIPAIANELTSLALEFEIIFVTDLNTDNTWDVLKSQKDQDHRIKLIKLSNGFGQHVAILAGLQYCNGNAALIMDGDMEMPASGIPLLYNKYKSGYDIVYGSSKSKNQSIIKDSLSRLFNKVMGWLSDYSLNNNTDMFRIISRRTIKQILKFTEIEPNITYIMSYINFPSAFVEIKFEERIHGETNYSLFRQLQMAFSSLLSFSTKPIKFISMLGFIISLLSFLYLMVILIEKLFFSTYGGLGFGTLVVLITFFSGIQLFAIGVIGGYLGRTFIQSKNRPLYIIDEILE